MSLYLLKKYKFGIFLFPTLLHGIYFGPKLKLQKFLLEYKNLWSDFKLWILPVCTWMHAEKPSEESFILTLKSPDTLLLSRRMEMKGVKCKWTKRVEKIKEKIPLGVEDTFTDVFDVSEYYNSSLIHILHLCLPTTLDYFLNHYYSYSLHQVF